MTVQDNKIKKTAFCGLVLALALIAGYAENLVPVAVAIPGIKLGAANSVILILLYMVGVPLPIILTIRPTTRTRIRTDSAQAQSLELCSALSQ